MHQVSDSPESQDSNQSIESAVCIVGAGFSGLAAARALRNRNIAFTCMDIAEGIGGVWHHSAGGTASAAYRSLHLNTSRNVTGYTGFPIPKGYPRYPRIDQVSAYLSSFAEHHGLREHIELGSEVIAVAQQSDLTWRVTTRNRGDDHTRTRIFRHVVVATGQHWQPQLPEPSIPGSASFTGESLHSFEYYEPNRFADKRVLILGIGNSACDIAVELSRIATNTTISMRRGAHVVPKQMMGIPIDEIAASRWWSVLPFRAQRGFIEFLLRIIRGTIASYGIPEPDHRLFSAPVTISDELLSRINHGEIDVRSMIDRVDSSTVHFADGSSADFDAIIYCTGYRLTFPFIPPESVFSDSGQVALFQRVVPPDHPGLYFAGLIRPVGSITRLVESQSEWIADLIERRAMLPTEDEMAAEIETHLAGATKRYGSSAMDSIQIDFPTYLGAIKAERRAGRRRTERLADAVQLDQRWSTPTPKPTPTP